MRQHQKSSTSYVVEYYLIDNPVPKYVEVDDADSPLKAVQEVKFTEGEHNVVLAVAHVIH